MIEFICNNETVKCDLPAAYLLIDFIRNNQKLKGTKEGCREGDCGICSVLLGSFKDGQVKYKIINSCRMPLEECRGKHIVTIEGLKTSELSFVQQQFIEEGADQCSFCMPGFIISLTGYLLNYNKPDYEEAISFVAGNICRCTGHISIKRAINNIVGIIPSMENRNGRYDYLIREHIIPDYFLNIGSRLNKFSETHGQPDPENPKRIIVPTGTDIMLQRGDELLNQEMELINPFDESDKIFIVDNDIHIKSFTSISEFESSEVIREIFPKMNLFIKLFGSKQIRNHTTLGGNIINGSPIADIANILLVLNSSVLLKDEFSFRKVLLNDFYIGYKLLDLHQDERLEEIIIPIPKNGYFLNFEKISRRTLLDIASVNSSIYLEKTDRKVKVIRISAGGVAPYPIYLKNTSEYLTGKNISLENLKEASEVLVNDISPISDIRGSKEYKTLLLKQLFYIHFNMIYPEIVKGLYEKH
jgi:xanthine dehydrogenase small subunit